MTIKKETISDTIHGYSTECLTCDHPIYVKRGAGYGVEQEAWDTAYRHDRLFDKKHSIIVYEHVPVSSME